MPRAFPWILILAARFPLVTAMELLRRLPGLRQLHDRAMVAHRLSWWKAQMAGREAEFDASSCPAPLTSRRVDARTPPDAIRRGATHEDRRVLDRPRPS